MNQLEHSSPDAKRSLLARLLQKRLQKTAPMLAAVNGDGTGFDRFAIPAAELAPEVTLDPAITFDAPLATDAGDAANVFLTGATGFLGAFLVAELLEQTQTTVHCLVRCSDAEQGRERIYKVLDKFLPGTKWPDDRIVPVAGDLSKPLFGLSPAAFEQLASTIDVVYHNGAMVHGLYTYPQLKPTNVLGTQESIRLAAQHRLKALHYVSTVAACPFEDRFEVKVVREQPLDTEGLLYSGYCQSKWVAEQTVLAARERGLPVCVYRPGIITGHSETGAWSTGDATCRVIKVTVDSGIVPDVEGAADMTPVDYVSKALVYLSRSSRCIGQIYHLANPTPADGKDLTSWVRTSGYPLRQVPYEEWRSEMVTLANRSDKNPLAAFAPLFSTVVSDKIPGWMTGMMTTTYKDGVDRVIRAIGARYGAQSVQLDCTNALRDLSGTGISCPAVDETLLNTYFAYFVRIGYLDAPAH
jgi:thioester reductase-like protein